MSKNKQRGLGFRTKVLEILMATIVRAGLEIGREFEKIGVEQEAGTFTLRATVIWRFKGENKDRRKTISIPNRYFKTGEGQAEAGLKIFDLVLPEIIEWSDSEVKQ